MTFNWQFRISYLVLPIALFSTIVLPNTKLNDSVSRQIVEFTLFNYDNLIADYYEDQGDYIIYLTNLIANQTDKTQSEVRALIFNDDVASQSNPVQFMLKINQQLKNRTGVYFVD